MADIDFLHSRMHQLILALREKLEDIVKRNSVDCLLFSGGLDTSILAALNPDVLAITVSLESSGEDIKYAKSLAQKLNLRHCHKIVGIDEAIDSIPMVIKILKSFDPAIPNDLVVYFGLKLAKELGAQEIMTGDGADELFAGYSFMDDLDDLEAYIQRISKNVSFSSNDIGKFFGIKIIQPFLDKKVIDLSLKIPASLKVKRENGKLLGKWILRKAFEDLLPKEIIWQDKRPLEYGSGMTELRKIISSKITDSEFEERKRLYPINFLNKEHLYYYEIYRKEIGDIPRPKDLQKECPGCGAGMERTAFHCKICGYISNWRSK
ncbi:MAG: asparagine synthase-related protein [Nitrospirota bacterium]